MSDEGSVISQETTLGLSERIYLHIYDYETKEFSGLTTYHGLVRIYNSNTWPSRIFWCVVVLSCLSLFMIHSGYLLLGYHAKPTLFQVNTIVAHNGLKFPDITICPNNPIIPEKLKRWNISDELAIYLLQYYSNPIEINNKLEEELQLYKDSYVKTYHKSFHVEQFLLDVGPTCEDSIVGLSFSGETQFGYCQYATSVLTDVGPCIRFIGNKMNKTQLFAGSAYGLVITVDSKNNLKSDSLPRQFAASGVRVHIHEPNKMVSLRSNGVNSPPGAALHASIRINNVTLLSRMEWGVCQRNWTIGTDVLIPKNYTSHHCTMNCKISDWLNRCGCVPLELRINQSHPLCSLEQTKQCGKEDARCVCDMECDRIDYNMQISYSDLTQRSLEKEFDEEYIEDSITQLHLYFTSISYDRHEQQKQLQTADLLSNIAGSMGLFLGMSTVTLLEIFIYLFKSVWGTVNTERQQQFMQAMLEEEEERRQSVVIVEEPEEIVTAEPGVPGAQNRRQSRRVSIVPLHIHLDGKQGRRDSSFLGLPRRSISVAPLVNPLAHRQSIAAGALGRRGSAFLDAGEIIPTRRGSQSYQRLDMSGGRRLSIQPADDAIHLSIMNPHGLRRKSSVNPRHFLL